VKVRVTSIEMDCIRGECGDQCGLAKHWCTVEDMSSSSNSFLVSKGELSCAVIQAGRFTKGHGRLFP
jgi:hypothetical protein